MAINLLPHDLQVEHKIKNQQLVANIISVALLILMITGVVVLFSYRVYLSRQMNDVNSQVNDLATQVNKYKSVEGTLKAIQLKLGKVRDSIAKNYPYGTIVDDLQLMAGNDVQITGVTVQKQENFILEGATDSLTNLATYLKNLDEQGEHYTGTKINKINFNNKSFQYTFAINFVYKP
jgi:hypothetical protein